MKRRTWRLDCKGSPSRTQWSSRMARDGSLAISSNSTTSDQETSRASPARVRAWAALRASSVESRFEAQHETKLTPLVGRDEELELLLCRWRQAVEGEGRVVLLSGEPGIGKSRLIVALEEQLQTGQYTPLGTIGIFVCGRFSVMRARSAL